MEMDTAKNGQKKLKNVDLQTKWLQIQHLENDRQRCARTNSGNWNAL